MKITTIERWRVRVPMKPDTVNSPEYDSRDPGLAGFWEVPKFIIRLTTDDGMAGIGETGRGCPEEHVLACAAAVEGKDPRRMNWQALEIPRNSAYGCFEMAIYDLLGRHLDVPTCRLLGQQVRNRVLVDYWTARRTPADLARKAREGKERGFHGIKIKCALEDPNVERIQAVAEAVGKEFRVTVDPNCRFYQPAHAVQLADALGNHRECVAVFEDPVPKGNLDWYVLLRQKLKVPLALHLGSPLDVLNAVKREAVDFLNISPGSMAMFVKCCFIAEQAGVPVWHGSGVDLGIMDMSYVHACAAAPAATLPSDIVGNFLREDDLLVEPIQFEDGHAVVPDKGGLGIELDEEAVRKYQVQD
jgi:muconate cycloisomerase